MKNLLIGLIIFFILTSIPFSFAQINLGEPALVKEVVVTIKENGEVYVVHEVRGSAKTVAFSAIEGDISNLKVTNVEGNEVQHATTGGYPLGIMIFPSEKDVLVEYNLENVLFLNDGMWKMEFRYLETVVFKLPENLEMVFVNSNPVRLDETNNFRCHGCQMVLEYSFVEPVMTGKINWEGKDFELMIKSFAEIDSVNFNQPAKSLSFDLKGENQYVTVVIPLELLWNPYEVFLDDKKILKHEFFQNETHAWLNVKPETSGTLTLIGTSVVPEFSIFMPLFFGIAIVIVFQFKNKINLH